MRTIEELEADFKSRDLFLQAYWNSVEGWRVEAYHADSRLPRAKAKGKCFPQVLEEILRRHAFDCPKEVKK